MSGAWHNLGIVCGQINDQAAAMNAFRQEVIWAPTNVRAWYDLGVTLEKMGRREEAKLAFARVDSLSPRKLARTARVHLPPPEEELPPGSDLSATSQITPTPDEPKPEPPMTPQRLAELS